jgi:hypothetical protein
MYSRRSPFLVIASFFCSPNWYSLLNDWTDFRLRNLSRTRRDRQVARQYCLFSDASREFLKPEVVVTSFPALMDDVRLSGSIEWLSVVIDDQTSSVKLDVFCQAAGLRARHRVAIFSKDRSPEIPEYAGGILRFDEAKQVRFEDVYEIRKFVDLSAFQLSLYCSVLLANLVFIGMRHANTVVFQKLLGICHHPFLDNSLDDDTPGLEAS